MNSGELIAEAALIFSSKESWRAQKTCPYDFVLECWALREGFQQSIVIALETAFNYKPFFFNLLKKIFYLLNQKLKNGRHFHSNFIYSIECFSALKKKNTKKRSFRSLIDVKVIPLI